MDLERVALEAVKVKIQEIFDEILVTAHMEGKSIVIKIALPDEIMNRETSHKVHIQAREEFTKNNNLDKEAQAAADELLGTNQQEIE